MRDLLVEFRRGAVADGPILAGLFIIWLLFLGLLASKGEDGLQVASYSANFLLYLATGMLFIIFKMGVLLVRHRPDRPIGFLKESIASGRLLHRMMRGAPMLIALVIFLPAFSAMKGAIPLFNPYAWDDTWVWLDRVLHGTDPWRLLQVVFGYPLVTSMISAFYHLWILLIYAGEIYFCFFQNDRELRARYFIANFACWSIIGVGMATAFASIGPCFLEPLLGDHRFDEQMAYLRSANEHFPVLVLPVQDGLVAGYLANDGGLGRGISAMPSMHVSVAFLFFMAMRKVSKRAALFFGVFAAIILIGSVHLAYHYAVDGYVAIAATWLIWLASGPLARRVAQRGGDA